MKKIERTLDSREVAEMVGKNHADLMRDIRRYCEQLNESNIALVDFFKEADYKDGKGQNRPCYNVTKKGCEFISHKLTGIKGTEFTARYINRFHDMEDTIREGIPSKEKTSNTKRPALSSVNMMVKNVMKTLESANVQPVFVAAEVKRLYTDLGYEVKVPLITDKTDMPKLYDCTEIAKELGIMSTSGLPHIQAVGVIIKKLHINESEIVTTAFSRNGHNDVTTQYKPSVLEDVKLWLAENCYPTKIVGSAQNGRSKTCTVVYQDVA